MALNGGWWLVVWFPWVSKHEVDIHSWQEALALTTISRNLMISRIMFMFGLRTGAHKVTVTSY